MIEQSHILSDVVLVELHFSLVTDLVILIVDEAQGQNWSRWVTLSLRGLHGEWGSLWEIWRSNLLKVDHGLKNGDSLDCIIDLDIQWCGIVSDLELDWVVLTWWVLWVCASSNARSPRIHILLQLDLRLLYSSQIGSAYDTDLQDARNTSHAPIPIALSLSKQNLGLSQSLVISLD